MKNFKENFGITGHLTITKQFNDGNEEVVFDDHNIIVSGMGVGLSHLFTGSGSNSILDYQIDRFKLGVSGHSNNEVSSTYQLSGPLSLAQYGINTNLFVEEAHQLENGAIITSPLRDFALIPAHKITRINETSVRYTLVVDENTANGLENDDGDLSLDEVGLYMKNPTGQSGVPAPILVAYRVFSSIVKTSDFSLIFRWTINF